MISFGRLVSIRNSWTDPIHYRISAEATCPHGTKCDSSEWVSPEIIGVHWYHATAGKAGARWVGTADLRGANATVLEIGIAQIWNRLLAEYRYHAMPRALSESPMTTARRGVGDCAAMSNLLAQLLIEQGVPAKVCAGYIAGGLSARVHHWVEATDRDGQPKTLDLSMAMLAPMFFSSKYAEFCFGSKLNQVMKVPTGKSTMIRHNCRSQKLDLQPAIRLHRIRKGTDQP